MNTVRNLLAAAALLCLTLVSCATTPSASAGPQEMVIPKVLNWQGVPYSLAWTNDANGLMILEYLPEGQTTDAWETMITVQLSGESAAKAVLAFSERTKPYRTEDLRTMKNDKTGDILVDTILFDTANDSMEHNLIKFTQLKDGRLIKVFFQTKLKISAATANKALVSEKIGKPRLERINYLSTFQFVK